MLGERFNKNPGTKPGQPARTRLTPVYAIPTIRDIRILLAEAEKTRGILCELPIKLTRGMYLLSCQSDHLSKEPCWTLYEGEGSKQLWSYLNDNLEMIENIVGMSVLEKRTDEVATPAVAEQPVAVPLEAVQPAATPPAPQSLPADQPYDPFAWQTGGSRPEVQINPAPVWPSSPPDPALGNAGPGWGQAAPTPWQGQPDATWSQSGAAQWAANQWGAAQQSFTPEQSYVQPQRLAPPEPFVAAQTGATAERSAPPQSFADFSRSLAKKKHLTMAELAMDPLLPPACVDAALKLQEMVLKGHFDDKVAFQAFQLSVANNGILDDGVLARARSSAGNDPEEICKHASRLLQQAGLLSEKDVSDAEKNAQAHDGSFSTALLALGKADKLILEAAQECYPMVADGRLRNDQAIIALHYCARSRSKLKDALADLSISVD